ncbi:DUF4276 family protein [Roseateles sp. LYH14W]|uniref:DUF4276 family protein n=1 Tax=Pelomonas parva TaxID=3299032 RepID=A0ABW7F361_9BURK
MKELVFLVEGQAEKDLLDVLLPRALPDGVRHRVIPFEGKQDLEKQMGRRIRGYQNPAARFIVLRDQDSHADCKALKAGLLARCEGTGREAHCLVRIACTELETFYLADLAAVERALEMPGLARQQGSRKFRRPDALGSPSRELKTLTKLRYEKRAGSRLIGQQLDLDNERSPSFRHLVAAIRRLSAELDSA